MDDKYQRDRFQIFYEPVEMPGGYFWSHTETLKMIDLYYNSEFKTGNKDKKGFHKFFKNIVKPACDIATKFIDLDTKDVMLTPEAPGNELKVWMMQRKLRQWLKDKDFATFLNLVAEDNPKYGSVVSKATKDGVKKVNIQNLRMDPTAESLNKSEFVYELMTMSKREIKLMKDWDDNAKKELFGRGTEETFCVYDCYDAESEGWERTIKADLFTKKKGQGTNRGSESEINQGRDNYIGSVTLFSEYVDELPYDELHWEKVPGRWLGRGFVEYLKDNQIAENETENLERKGIHLKALQLYQTRDESIGGSNVLSDAENGDILRVTSEISPLAKENSDLAAFNQARDTWGKNTERKTFTTDITTGANLPSRTPLGVANLQASLASSFFDLKRENFGIFIKKIILYRTIPNFKNETYEEHILTFAGSDEELDKLDKTIADIKTDAAAVEYAKKTGFFPSKIQKEDLRSRILSTLKSNRYRFAKVPAGFYDGVKYILDVNTTNEAIDNGTRSQVIQMGLNLIGTNPGILQNEAARTMLFQLLALGGVSPVDLGLLNEKITSIPPEQQQMAQVAGSMAKTMGTPGMMSNTTQV